MNSIIDNEINLSVINKIELLSFHLENKNISEFIENANILELNNKVADITVDIRKKYKTKLPDAIIAATAIANNLTLISNNTRDFITIKNLKLINPYNDL